MEPYIGQINLFPYNRLIENWLPCEGQELQISQYSALFALIGNSFGGDGARTFAVPDLKDKAPAPNLRYCIALQGMFPRFA